MLANLLGFGARKPGQLAETIGIDTSHLRMIKYCITCDMARSTETARGIDEILVNI